MLKKGGDTLSMALTDQRKARVYAQPSIPQMTSLSMHSLLKQQDIPYSRLKTQGGWVPYLDAKKVVNGDLLSSLIN